MFDGLMIVEGIKRINSNKSKKFQDHILRLNKLHNFSVFNQAYSRFHTHSTQWDIYSTMIIKI